MSAGGYTGSDYGDEKPSSSRASKLQQPEGISPEMFEFIPLYTRDEAELHRFRNDEPVPEPFLKLSTIYLNQDDYVVDTPEEKNSVFLHFANMMSPQEK